MELQKLLKNLLLVAWWGMVGALAAYGASTIYETKFLATADSVTCATEVGGKPVDWCGITSCTEQLMVMQNKQVKYWKKEKKEYERCSYLGESVVVREY